MPFKSSLTRDGDGIIDYMDNCITVENGDQIDTDGDGLGQ